MGGGGQLRYNIAAHVLCVNVAGNRKEFFVVYWQWLSVGIQSYNPQNPSAQTSVRYSYVYNRNTPEQDHLDKFVHFTYRTKHQLFP